MKQRYLDANISLASREIPAILRKEKVHYSVQKSPLLAPIQTHLFMTQFNIILPSTSGFSKLRTPHPP
jgi:hypothetical protein